MLNKLFIQNYAIIDELTINFDNRLNIITGETGAGKSILMGALSLILGDRADSGTLQHKDKKCVVEGVFEVQNDELVKSFILANDLDAADEVVIRREITHNGKSRAFINDTPVNLSQLKQFSSLLVDLHQQFDTLELGESGFQQEVLDALAGNNSLIKEYRSKFNQYQLERKALQELQSEQAKANAVLDYNRFLFDELDSLNLSEDELESLEAEQKLLSNAEQVKQQLGGIYFELSESEQPIVQQLKSLYQKLHALEQYHIDIPSLAKRLQESQVELNDIAEEIDRINDGIQYNAERINIVNDRLSAGYKLLKKHNVQTTGELLSIRAELQSKLDAILNLSESIQQKENITGRLLSEAQKLALTLSANRKKAVKPFTEKVNALLKQVGMPNAGFHVAVETASLGETGTDSIEFLFNANLAGGREKQFDLYEPLRKVASGGELSRLMLCIKSLVARQLQLPTLIFDEIDTGISGEAAKQVGNIMKSLSASHQLIAITHQPQIAARADAHYFVFKLIRQDRIVTSVKKLNNDERITTIAQMLSGEKPTAAAMENAREMLGN